MKKLLIIGLLIIMCLVFKEIGLERFSDPYSLSEQEIEDSRNVPYKPYGTTFLPIPKHHK